MPDRIIDFRSDTVTQPTDSMRRAMAQAPVGDDVFGEDPTVIRLQEIGAELLGKAASLFVPSGTMGNLISLLVHCPRRGMEVIVGDESHIFNYEQGGASAVGGLAYHTLATDRFGQLNIESIRGAMRDPNNDHNAVPGVICLENTHNRCGGTVLPIDYCAAVRAVAQEKSVPMHLDGARLANAAVALGTSLKELAAPFDSVQFDLSKALGAPVGGLVAGSRDFVKQARRHRKLLGGGMRQAGVIAAAGIVAIEEMIPRLAEDHANARKLAQAFANEPKLSVDLETVQTNIMFVSMKPPASPLDFATALKAQGILVGAPRNGRLRFVTHYHVTPADIDRVISAAKAALKSL